jgi:hypothetical protein
LSLTNGVHAEWIQIMSASRSRTAVLSVLTAWVAGACDPGSLEGFDRGSPAGGGGSDASAALPGASGGARSGGAGGKGGSGTGGSAGNVTDASTLFDAPSDAPVTDGAKTPACTHHADLPDSGIPRVLATDASPSGALELGVQTRPTSIFFRDGAASGLVAGKPYWLFHDTRSAPSAPTPFDLPSTAAIGVVGNPLLVIDDVDAEGAPRPLLALRPEEAQFPVGDAGMGFSLLWPNTVVDDGKDALVFYIRVSVLPDLRFEYVGAGVARAGYGNTTATRDPEFLFESSKGEPTFHAGGIVDAGGYLYLYGCSLGVTQAYPCRLARAPRGSWTVRSAYRFYDGAGWNTDVSRAKAVLEGPLGEVTVSYNAYLRRYLAVYTPGEPNTAVFRVAERLEGPWSEATPLFQQQPPLGGGFLNFSYGAKEHPEFAEDCGRTIVVTYPRNLGGGQNELRVARVTFE